jgi:methionyl-tRNA formyltransferase
VRVVFMGTPWFAVPSLRALAASHEVLAVYTRPDSVSGRGSEARPSAVKAAAIQLGIAVRTPSSLRDAEEVTALTELGADVLVVAAYGLILPLGALEAARLGAINVHASLLPRWRGAAPIQRAILAGDERTGVSIMRVEEGLDTGPYCLQVATEIGSAGTVELTERLSVLGANALLSALCKIAEGTAEWTPQEDTLVTYAEKITKSDVAIRPELTQTEAVRRVRASSREAPCRITLAGRRITVLAAAIARNDASSLGPGAVAAGTKSQLLLGLADGALAVTDVKPEGKGPMHACDWLHGVRDLAHATWEAAQ